MAAITQTISPISPLAPPPNPSIPSTFDGLAYTFSTSLKTVGDELRTNLVAEINTFKDQANLLRLEVNDSRDVAVAAEGVATTKASEAVISANAALASAASAAAIAGAFVGTSTSSLLIATGSKSFTTQLNEQYTAGVFLSAVSAANTANFMFGQVTSYNAATGALVINVSVIGGSGTFADWNISLTGAQGIQGPAGATFTGGSLTSAINTSRAIVASHATIADIWGALGNQIDWTGTATTTAFPNAPQAGAERVLICAGTCSFTAGANMLIDGVASGQSVTCAAGDTIIVRAISTTQFKLTRLKADGTPQVSVAGGSMIFLSKVTASNSATVDIETTFDATYDEYVLVATGVTITVANATLKMLFKIGGTYLTTATYQYHSQLIASGATTYLASASISANEINIARGDSTANSSINFDMNFYNVSSTTKYKVAKWNVVSARSETEGGFGIGSNSGIGALTGVRFLMSSGNIAAGEFKLYGIKKS